jgi:hypothetical protein
MVCPIWLQVKNFEGAVLYSGCLSSFGMLSTDEGTCMDVFARACLKNCSKDQEYEIAEIAFTNPEAGLGHTRVSHLYEWATPLSTSTKPVLILR